MKLVLLSGGQKNANVELHREVLALCTRKRVPHLTYVPYCSENANIYFQRFSKRYQKLTPCQVDCLPVDRPVETVALKRALRGDVIYLAGGNTYYFLHHLRKSGLLPMLKPFVQRGGILVGLSAGAIIMTPSIRLAGVPQFDADENEVGLTNLTGLKLTNFEFSPHFTPSPARIASLTAYSRQTPNPIYACADGGGIVIAGRRVSSYGKVFVFHRGLRFRATP